MNKRDLIAIGKMVGYFVVLLTGSLLWGWAFQHIGLLTKADTILYRFIFLGKHYRLINLAAEPFNYNLFFHVRGLPEDMPTFFYFMIAGVALYLWFKQHTKFWWFLGSVVLGNILVHLITVVDTHLLYRVRPFIALHLPIDPVAFKSWHLLSSFPSGHCRDTALYATLIALYVPKIRWFAVVLILFIAFMRVYLGAHYPSDVLAGTAIGTGVAFAIFETTKLLQTRSKHL